ncbi:MAG: hypothetical protein BWY06_03299 [Candidatus Latescibacteria bacterium ADurb.Bin168]|nr:MAG: hypothetical protein BWY06_03299 [Candidatus Latescibacteria bacterium ADurb.Bin168]
MFVAQEMRGRGGFDLRKRNDFLLLRGAGTSALLLHQFFKAGRVHGQTAFPRHQFGEVERETLFVVKLESECTRDLTVVSLRQFVHLFLKQRNAFIQRLVEGFFLDANHVLDIFLSLPNFGKDVAHGVSKHVHQFVEKRFPKTE